MKKIIVLLLTLAMMMTAMAACSSGGTDTPSGDQKQEETAKEPSLEEIVQAVRDAYGENYLPSMSIEGERLADIYGVNMDEVEEYIAEEAMISAHVDILIAVKAKQGKGEEIQQQLQDYMDYMVENSLQYPMNIAKVQSGKVVRHGDYVFYFILGGYDDRDDASEEESIQFAQQQMQIGEDTIAEFFA